MPQLASIWTVDIVVAFVSAILMLWACAFYYRKARKMASSFSIGLTLFTVLFVVQNVLAVVFYFRLAENHAADVAFPMLTLNALGLGAFATLVWIIRR